MSAPVGGAATRVDLRRVGVVVVTYQSAGTVVGCLDSLPLDRLGTVVVVDNGSTDGTVAALRPYRNRVRVVVSDANRGFAAGVNQGVAALLGEAVVVVANPDVVATPGAIDALVAAVERDPSIAVAGPSLADGAGRLRYDVRRFSTPLTELRWLLPGKVQRAWPGPHRRVSPRNAVYRDGGDVAYVQGAFFVVRREALVQTGGLDERLFLYCEEEMLCRRLWSLSWRVVYVPAARVAHLGGASTGAVPLGTRHHLFASTYLLLRSWYGRGAAAFYAAFARLAWSVPRRARRSHLDALRAARSRVRVASDVWAVASIEDGVVRVERPGRCVIERRPDQRVDPRSWPAAPCHAVTTGRVSWRQPRDAGSVREPAASVRETWPPAPPEGS